MSTVTGATPAFDRSAADGPGKGLAILRAAALTGAVRRASDHAVGELGSERLLPVLPALRELLPGRGLRRGATVAVTTIGGRNSDGNSQDSGDRSA